MRQLISKLQYNNFEHGEFVDAQLRTYEETIALIENFPWREQREKIEIGLTGPSVIIEGDDGSYLKYACYYNKQYALYYYNSRKELFVKSLNNSADAKAYIAAYFTQDEFDVSAFRKENTFARNISKHFISKSFKYTTSTKSNFVFFVHQTILDLISVAIICYCSTLGQSFENINFIGLAALIFIVLLVVGFWTKLILFIEHQRIARGKCLILSKGSSTFSYGDEFDMSVYDKSFIREYIIKQKQGQRSFTRGFALTGLILKDGSVIKLPNLLISEDEVIEKLPTVKGRVRSTIPWT
ncbi:MAG: hypothetical protein RL660_702 [Bacteroidota bacterium]